MDKHQRNLACLSLLLGSSVAWATVPSAEGPGPAEPTASSEPDLSSGLSEIKLSDARLDEMRGGFDVAPGLHVAFGIERMVFVNGELIATTSFNIPNVAQITPQQAQTLASALGTTTLVQNGPGNSFQPVANLASGATSGAATIVQNTLNNQAIKALTTINATVNTLGAYQALNLQSTLDRGIANAVAPR
ncbi:hypothetical protein [Pararobbsia alpina]|uniref:Uncharacterized protein n=1 Tax=Pararobbsia alpina TaxID=621374 RepID=A0A6S7CSU7_9BURK|nr:hypothetical protein [Pararobbsia alpina]CAB3787263.1 hypothetical protein LMG28138_02406 [Pararobbsia alpina]